MTIKGLKAIQQREAQVKKDNLNQWYERNPWASGAQGYSDDYDYAGPGLDAAFFDIPNM